MVDSPTRLDSRGAALLVVLGHACFVATMLGCYAIEPSARAVRLGLSYYGNHLATVGPYSTGFGLCITLTILGLRRMRTSDAAVRRFRSSVGIVTASDAPDSTDAVQRRSDLRLASSQRRHGALRCRLSPRAVALLTDRHDRFAQTLFAVQTLAAFAIVAAQFGLNDYMIPSELCFQLAVVGLVVRQLRKLARLTSLQRGVRNPHAPASSAGA